MPETASRCYTPTVIVDTAGLTEEEWLEYRRQGLGGSDCSAALGVSPFTTARDLYYDKKGIVSAVNDEDNWVQLEVGHLLEDLVAQIFARKTGYRIYQIKRMFRHPVYGFMLADIDYFVELPDGRTAILECKTTNYNAKDKWWSGKKETVPLNYELQGRHYMAVMNLDRVYYCCLYGNNENEVIIRHIDRDIAFESEMIALEENFWMNHVLKNVPPPYTEDGDLVIESVRRHHGNADKNSAEVVLSEDASCCLADFLELQQRKSLLDAQVKVMDSEMKRLRGIVTDEMGGSCSAMCRLGGVPYAVSFNPTYTPGIMKDNLMRLKADFPEIYERYATMSESRRFYVKHLKEEAA